MFNAEANNELVEKITANAMHVLDALIEDLKDMNGISDDTASRLYFSNVTICSRTKVWYEFLGYHHTIYATLDSNGFLVAVLETDEFDDYED